MWMAGKAMVDRGTEGRLVRGGEGCTGGVGERRSCTLTDQLDTPRDPVVHYADTTNEAAEHREVGVLPEVTQPGSVTPQPTPSRSLPRPHLEGPMQRCVWRESSEASGALLRTLF